MRQFFQATDIEKTNFNFKAINITILFMIIDMVLNFFSSYFSKGEAITDYYKIRKNYLKKNFFIDIYGLVFLIILQNNETFIYDDFDEDLK